MTGMRKSLRGGQLYPYFMLMGGPVKGPDAVAELLGTNRRRVVRESQRFTSPAVWLTALELKFPGVKPETRTNIFD